MTEHHGDDDDATAAAAAAAAAAVPPARLCQRDECGRADVVRCFSCPRAFCKPCWRRIFQMRPALRRAKGLERCSVGPPPPPKPPRLFDRETRVFRGQDARGPAKRRREAEAAYEPDDPDRLADDASAERAERAERVDLVEQVEQAESEALSAVDDPPRLPGGPSPPPPLSSPTSLPPPSPATAPPLLSASLPMSPEPPQPPQPPQSSLLPSSSLPPHPPHRSPSDGDPPEPRVTSLDGLPCVRSTHPPRVLRGTHIRTLSHDSAVFCVCFSADGRLLATGCRASAQVFDVPTGIKRCQFSVSNVAAEIYVRGVAFTPDGRYLVTASGVLIRVWELASQRLHTVLAGHRRMVSSMALSKCGRFVASGSGDGTVRLWNIATGLQTMCATAGVIATVALSPDGRLVAAGGSRECGIRIWDASTGGIVHMFRDHTDIVFSVVFSPSGTSLLSGSLDKTIKLWDLGSRSGSVPEAGRGVRVKTFQSYKFPILSASFLHPSDWVMSGSTDGRIIFWDFLTGCSEFKLDGHSAAITSVAASPVSYNVGSFATASLDTKVKIWAYRKPGVSHLPTLQTASARPTLNPGTRSSTGQQQQCLPVVPHSAQPQSVVETAFARRLDAPVSLVPSTPAYTNQDWRKDGVLVSHIGNSFSRYVQYSDLFTPYDHGLIRGLWWGSERGQPCTHMIGEDGNEPPAREDLERLLGRWRRGPTDFPRSSPRPRPPLSNMRAIGTEDAAPSETLDTIMLDGQESENTSPPGVATETMKTPVSLLDMLQMTSDRLREYPDELSHVIFEQNAIRASLPEDEQVLYEYQSRLKTLKAEAKSLAARYDELIEGTPETQRDGLIEVRDMVVGSKRCEVQDCETRRDDLVRRIEAKRAQTQRFQNLVAGWRIVAPALEAMMDGESGTGGRASAACEALPDRSWPSCEVT